MVEHLYIPQVSELLLIRKQSHCVLIGDPHDAIHGHVDVLNRLLTAGGTSLVDSEDSCGTTPLMDAVRFGSKECSSLLLNSGASLERRDKMGRNVLHIAAQSGSSSDILDLLLDKNCLQVNCRTANGQTALHLAARENQVGCLEHLLSIGADPALRDDTGATGTKFRILRLLWKVLSVQSTDSDIFPLVAAGDVAMKFNNRTLCDILRT
ncbi:serine/threonine-protein phosphatase 6 regulatory ankyrin repeat subunit C [Galendromus occidentalis]|uniref:Alpha-latrotoxin n=1 Tax=Galendromus occidentalis TaxID=34638 RepID=A0AAJ6QXN7_9ACAR|nr:serine/threonine-protein phosphatase 6 regulatory ankyrin repeat subunit C [Galendromus occidentalis]